MTKIKTWSEFDISDCFDGKRQNRIKYFCGLDTIHVVVSVTKLSAVCLCYKCLLNCLFLLERFVKTAECGKILERHQKRSRKCQGGLECSFTVYSYLGAQIVL